MIGWTGVKGHHITSFYLNLGARVQTQVITRQPDIPLAQAHYNKFLGSVLEDVSLGIIWIVFLSILGFGAGVSFVVTKPGLYNLVYTKSRVGLKGWRG